VSFSRPGFVVLGPLARPKLAQGQEHEAPRAMKRHVAIRVQHSPIRTSPSAMFPLGSQVHAVSVGRLPLTRSTSSSLNMRAPLRISTRLLSFILFLLSVIPGSGGGPNPKD